MRVTLTQFSKSLLIRKREENLVILTSGMLENMRIWQGLNGKSTSKTLNDKGFVYISFTNLFSLHFFSFAKVNKENREK